MNKIVVDFLLRGASFRFPQQSYHALRRNYSFKSDISLDKIYPSSNLRLYTPSSPSAVGDKFTGFIPLEKLDVTHSRSSGPGGQNVNTVSTKVDIRFHLESASWLSENTRKRLAELQKNRITKDGYLFVRSELTRSQQMNIADALEKLRNFIRAAEKPIEAELSPETQEMLRRRHEKATRERLAVKRSRSQTKTERGAPLL
ncbi:large ribosomal subunit protein mL62 [Armigeres subalbatus]|uniref:large ribosomal subunit protein mL62 n=1 Tax=Armigeres subalbatus TaxID=124917 RepID=UPI002ED16ED0